MFSGRRCSRICECRIHRLRSYYSFVPSPYVSYYRPQTNLRKGNVFSSVCLEFCPQRRGVYTPQAYIPWADIPPSRHPSLPSACWDTHTPLASACWDTPPAQCMLGYGQQAGGTHPTGMHSCSKILLLRTLG